MTQKITEALRRLGERIAGRRVTFEKSNGMFLVWQEWPGMGVSFLVDSEEDC